MGTFGETGHRQRGAVALAVALVLLPLLAVAGLALDLGQLFVAKTELQNAMDACALAASHELRYHPTVATLRRAETAGKQVGWVFQADPRYRNRVRFQSEDIAPDAIIVTFSDTLGGGYVSADAAPPNTEFVRCTTRRDGILLWLISLWPGVGSDRGVAATAVASLQGSAIACGIPLGMCRKSPPDDCGVGNPGPDAEGLCVGKWYLGRFGSHISETGNFNWLDFDAHGGGANEIKFALEGPGICNIQVGVTQVHGQPGNLGEAAGTAWNSRFGLYKNGAGNPDATTAPPDLTGYAYATVNWPTGRDAYGDFLLQQNARSSYGPAGTTKSGNDLTGLGVQNSFRPTPSGSGPGAHGDVGANGRRVVAMPIVNCAGWGPTHTTTVGGWGCALMLTPYQGPTENMALEYLGKVGPANDKCATYGGPAGTGPRVPTLVQ